MSTQEIVMKKAASHSVVFVRDTIPVSAIGGLFGELFGHLGQHGVGPVAPPYAVYYDEEFREEAIDVEAAAPVAAPLPETDRVKNKVTEPAANVATIIHEGAYDTIGATYTKLLSWIEENGYRNSGPVREVYVRGVETGDDPSTYITEIQMPVDKA